MNNITPKTDEFQLGKYELFMKQISQVCQAHGININYSYGAFHLDDIMSSQKDYAWGWNEGNIEWMPKECAELSWKNRAAFRMAIMRGISEGTGGKVMLDDPVTQITYDPNGVPE